MSSLTPIERTCEKKGRSVHVREREEARPNIHEGKKKKRLERIENELEWKGLIIYFIP